MNLLKQIKKSDNGALISSGGCGACLVMVARYNPDTKEVKESSVNSCLVLLCSIDGCAITTSEGLGNQRDGFHAIHKRLSAFHGSQCGYCTPGMTMAIYNCLRHNQQRHLNSAFDGDEANSIKLHTGPTTVEMEKALQGNICRCTGYRSILDVCKSFASDVDLEDLGLNTCWTNKTEAKQGNLPHYDPASDPTFPKFLMQELEARQKVMHKNESVNLATREESADESLDARFTHVERSKEGEKERAWISARNFTDLSAALKALNGRREEVQLVVGNTSSGFYKDQKPQVFVDISQIPELLAVSRDSHGLEIGAATRISELIDYLEDFGANPIAQGLGDHMKKIAGGHVRNWGSVGGNLVMAQKFTFESDMATILLGVGASVKVVTFNGQTGGSYVIEKLSLDEFLGTRKLDGDMVLQSVYIPLDDTSHFRTYRGAPRPYGNAISYGNAAFFAHVLRNGHQGIVIESVRLAFGAFGTRHAIRALTVEELLRGKILSLSLVKASVELLKKEVVPLEGTEKKEYRISLVVGFLFEFLNSLLSSNETIVPTPLFPHVGKQLITVTDERYPLSQPMAKFQSELQASGEAVYVDDIPSPPHCLHAALVLSSEPYANLKGFDTEAALKSPGAVAYISLKDIPTGGKNVGYLIDAPETETEVLFPEDITGYVGQPLGVMVADTYDNAKFAAARVRVNYDTHGLEPPIFTCDDAVAKNSLFSVPKYMESYQHHQIGDVEKVLAEAEFQLEGEITTSSQSHFYMETQVTLAVPEVDGSMTLYTATQAPDFLQQSLAACLNLPLNKVRIICGRIGGSFGGKGFRTQIVAIAVALAAHKLRRPVRISLDRNTDMQTIGGRAPSKSKFTVAFTKTGKITGLKLNVLLELGWFIDLYLLVLFAIDTPVKKYNYGTLDLTFTLCKTNNVPKTTVRGPGFTQANAIADSVLDHVASYLGIGGNNIREENLHSIQSLKLFQDVTFVGNEDSFTLPAIWNRLKIHARVHERETDVEIFNKHSRWLKRGLAMVPIIYHSSGSGNTSTVSIFLDGSVVAEVGGVEMGQGLYTKVRQTIAYALSSLCSKEEVLKILDNIQVLPIDTLHLPNTWMDAGSTTSVSVCATVQKACGVLVQRLLPLKEELSKSQSNGNVSWETLCLTAKLRQIDLQSHERWDSPNHKYLIYGAGVSEVEVNILTGETTVLAADIIYDAGKSLNHLVDIGQVEGAFVFGLGFYLTEEILRNSKGKVVSDGTWTYKPPTIDIIPQSFNVELYKSPYHNDEIFSSKAVGEPPLLLSSSVFSAIRMAISAARKDYKDVGGYVESKVFGFSPPATLDKVKKLCGFDNVEKYLQSMLNTSV
ncbi:hypothetical protein M758_11G082900 [Ceratodon purpureus]|nr:hypothetical protein M758_11G082900 [Ceratodon purpureus]